MATQRNWQVGDKIKCRYEISKIFGGPGKSGMGIVYVCYDHELQEPVAIKTLQDRYLQDNASIERFRKEAETWFKLSRHPNIVELKKLERIENRLFIFLEYIVGDEQYGVDLEGWIVKCGLFKNEKPDIPLILNFAIQFCHGMMYAQDKYKSIREIFVHRDIKPQNIMITQDKVVKVTDFGLIKSLSNQEINQDELDREFGNRHVFVSHKGIYGTPPYMSPEQCRGEQVDIRSDIYSFGCVLYEMLTGRKIFFAKTPREFIYHHVRTNPMPPSSQSELDAIVMKCLEKEKQDRYEDFEALEKNLAIFYYRISGETIQAPKGSEFDLVNIGGSPFTMRDTLFALGNVRIEFKGGPKIDPNSGEGHYRLGILYMEQSKPDMAIAEWGKALEMNPSLAGPHYMLAEVYSKQDKLDKAVEEYKESIKLNPNYDIAHYKLANVYYLREKLDAAAEEYKEALKLNPKFTYAHMGLGNVYLQQWKLDLAIKEYLAAIKLDPKIAETHYELGLAYSKKAMYDIAIEEYKEALRLKPGFLLAHYELGIAHYHCGDLKVALKCFESFIYIAPFSYNSYVIMAKKNISDIRQKQ